MALSIGASIFILCDTLNGFQPLSYFNYHTYDNDYVERPDYIPEDYIHWLHIFNDSHGDYVDVLYPQKVNIGEDIIVLYHGIYQEKNEWKMISWRHGESFLFKNEILPLLKEEWTYDFDLGNFVEDE